ncbi:MAG: acetyl-CoA carboxylase biotin carboxylase subunit [Candidatus Bipolaricaulota bacterium]|nr:acetyl-CoA carboxylase biotin carboxylase subunit [Candidatus Bipolaricaulota bacterium]MDW8126902.1 acetyl-CoA carboxylase biotin carboxylase subunit [Candidatus Bipolaricaulota bacterium]
MEKVLIANRGEIALRILEACREEGLFAVAVYSAAEAEALHVREAPEAVCIGPPDPRRSYLSIPALIAACEITGADALHPGYGFLSENPDLAEVCEAHGITFIGPSAQVLRLCGDKVAAKEAAQNAGLPVLPGSPPLADESEALNWAEELGYPVLLKAAAGGGGRGIRLIRSPQELRSLFHQSRKEAELAFADGRVYLERYVPRPRHVEVQILADRHGNVVHWGTRDCTVQRRHQKLVEEAPAPALPPKLREKMAQAAVRLAEHIRYVGAGTVEFLVDGEDFYFIEVNARIQVEHPVSEMLVGRNLVREQLRVAQGKPLGYRQSQIEFFGHAIECRINAEDPERNFLPSTGRVWIRALPGGMGVRVDTHIYQGMRVLPYYDPLLAKIIAHGEDREEARTRLYSALRRFQISGVKTNRDFLLSVIGHPQFARAFLGTDFLEQMRPGE